MIWLCLLVRDVRFPSFKKYCNKVVFSKVYSKTWPHRKLHHVSLIKRYAMRSARHFWDESLRRIHQSLFSCLPPEVREGEAWTEDCCLCLVTPRARVCTIPSPLLSLSLLWSPRYKCGVSRSRSCLSRSPAAGDHNLASPSPLSPILPEPEPGWCQSPRYDGGGHTRSGNTWTRSIGGGDTEWPGLVTRCW